MRPALALALLTSCAGSDTPPEPVRLVRLTSLQWENATAELLELDTPSGLSERFVPNPAAGEFDNNEAALDVSPILIQQYQGAALTLAEETTSAAERYEAIVGVDKDSRLGAAARKAWVAEFGKRAFRRDLTQDELDAYDAVFAEGEDVHPNRSSSVAGVQHTIAGFLQSPHFLYRVERARPGADELEPVSFASRLSFALWNAPPDDALLRSARRAGQAEALLDEVPRLLDDDRGHAMVRDLHRQLFHVDSYANIPRDFVSHEDYSTTANAAMEAEVEAFVDGIVYGEGTVSDLFTSTQTRADANISDIYGTGWVRGSGAGWLEPVELDPNERAGLLTLSGFLAMHSSEEAEDLIRRSAFVHEAVLCNKLPPPPPDATALPLDDTGLDEDELTMRDRIDLHTGECGGACHSDMLNPLAYAFGQYDQMGRFRDDPDIDATATFTFESGQVRFDGAVELSEILADEAQVHRCYASHLMSYLEGRTLTSEDNDRVDALTSASLAGEPILSLIQDIVEDEAFRAVR